ncbi:glycosyltransferase [Microbacterium murale]|uniref:Glycosyltransferase involved in cell wall biosynthesis n=1 Tax=Microbacterium murale TaxID=1081040 RepID=A0ABU0PDP7_9MICO|nr:glycosyltransferase [Microbacterium murale]MDQ0645052.1 glycosyltransferase involved in cell wall biosynthesis [Microbacterium murale]
MNDVRVSVCMATYNGAAYLAAQLDSILAELEPQDEVIIVDDASSDGTVALLEAVADPRVSIHARADNRGYVRTFEQALSLATGDVLMLSDQDDVWIAGRRERLIEATADHAVAASNLVLLGDDAPLRSPLTGRDWLLREADGSKRWRNQWRILIGDAPYFGCTMAIRREFLASAMPFPGYLTESHDLWIATLANTAGELAHLEQPTLRRRLHDDNASTERPRGIRQALCSRMLLLRLWREARRRVRRP